MHNQAKALNLDTIKSLKKLETLEINKFIKSVDLSNRNLIRDLIYNKDSSKYQNYKKLKTRLKTKDILNLEEVLRVINARSETFEFIDSLFPDTPQINIKVKTSLDGSFKDSLALINAYVGKYDQKLSLLLTKISDLNKTVIFENNFEKADIIISEIVNDFGFSHLIIRKIILLNQICEIIDIPTPNYTREFIRVYNGDGKNTVISSLQQCYQEGIDYIGLKNSILNYYKQQNFFSAILRYPFNNYTESFNPNDLNVNLQHLMRSSLIDALFFIANHKKKIDLSEYKNIDRFNELILKEIEQKITIQSLSQFYLNLYENDYSNAEDSFRRQVSAWFEIQELEEYSLFHNLFNEGLDNSDKIFNNSLIMDKLNNFVTSNGLLNLIENTKLDYETDTAFSKLLKSGSITKSALFNYKIFQTKGMWKLTENDLFWLMSNTQDLPRTVNGNLLKVMSKQIVTPLSKIILYMLISKKTQNNLDDSILRNDIQELVIKEFEGSLVDFVENLYQLSPTVAYYAYEIFTEDFIAVMPEIIRSTTDITEVRANLHEWRGSKDTTSASAYFERARTLRIDHQINRIRNEINDNRIYVDIPKFNEWLFNDAYRDLSLILSGLIQYNFQEYESPQLIEFIEKVYQEFCTNKIFGISSYLGRRIRHGTFKGHMYTTFVKNLENEFDFLENSPFAHRWQNWKKEYESQIDKIIFENLHVESPKKKHGLIKTSILSDTLKHDIAKSCVKDLMTDYLSNNGTGLLSILNEYCWRLISTDLKHINEFLKEQKNTIQSFANNSLFQNSTTFDEYNRKNLSILRLEFLRLLDEKFKMLYEWFNRPQNVAPRAEISLLFAAVTQEVKDSFEGFGNNSEILHSEIIGNEHNLELFGNSYLIIYDALFVIIYNAAKHGKRNTKLEKEINLDLKNNKIYIKVSSQISDDETESSVREKIKIDRIEDIENAQIFENKSGIKKLYHLQAYDKSFKLEEIKCENRKVQITISYKVNFNA